MEPQAWPRRTPPPASAAYGSVRPALASWWRTALLGAGLAAALAASAQTAAQTTAQTTAQSSTPPTASLNPQAAASVAAVQAAFIFNFARFTEWPGIAGYPDGNPAAPGNANANVTASTHPNATPATLGTRVTTLNFCMSGSQPALSGALQNLAGRTVQGRSTQFSVISRYEELKSCQVAFMADADPQKLNAALGAVAGLPVLTVSDSPGFARRGGIIGMLRVGDKLRFEINRGQAQQAGLKLTAELLNLAVHVFDVAVHPGEEAR